MTLKDNAENLTLIAQEIGAEGVRGPVPHGAADKFGQHTIGGDT